MLVVASTTPSATPYTARADTNTPSPGATAIRGTATAIRPRPSRNRRALEWRFARISAAIEPTPASPTIISNSSDSETSDRSQCFWIAGSLVVRLMKTRPWVAKAAATAARVRVSVVTGR